jgi:dolichol kinase
MKEYKIPDTSNKMLEGAVAMLITGTAMSLIIGCY